MTACFLGSDGPLCAQIFTNPRAAEIELSKALELGMDPNVVLPVLARTWILMGRSKELIAAHAETRLTNPTAAAELKAAVGLAYANTGDAPRARAMADAALTDDPQSARARVLQAQIALSDRRVDDALRSIDETLVAHSSSTPSPNAAPVPRCTITG